MKKIMIIGLLAAGSAVMYSCGDSNTANNETDVDTKTEIDSVTTPEEPIVDEVIIDTMPEDNTEVEDEMTETEMEMEEEN